MFEPVFDGPAPSRREERRELRWARILSAALMLDYLGLTREAETVNAAVSTAVVRGQGTKEIGGALGTKETGDYITSMITTWGR